MGGPIRRKEVQEAAPQGFRICDDDLGLAGFHRFFGLLALVRRLSAAENRAGETQVPEPSHLVLHEGEERIDDEGGTRKDQCWKLETQGLPETRRQDGRLAKRAIAWDRILRPSSLGYFLRPGGCGEAGIDDIGHDQPLEREKVLDLEGLPGQGGQPVFAQVGSLRGAAGLGKDRPSGIMIHAGITRSPAFPD